MSKVHYVNVYECGCCHFHIHCFHFFKCTYCFLTERRLVNASAAKTWIKLNINIYYYSAFPRPGHSRTWRAGCIAPRCHRHVSEPARKKPGPVFSYKLRYIVGLYENTGPGNIIKRHTILPQLCKKNCRPCSHFFSLELTVHIAKAVLPDTHLHLSVVKQMRVKCLTQRQKHWIKNVGRGETWYLSANLHKAWVEPGFPGREAVAIICKVSCSNHCATFLWAHLLDHCGDHWKLCGGQVVKFYQWYSG